MTKGGLQPNILWVMTDQQRYDTIAALGQTHVRTPNLDRLVVRGTSFTRTYVQSPICTPSRASIMTGRYPASHHAHRNGNAYFPSDEEVITRRFADAGYHTALIGKYHLSRADHRNEVRPEDGYRTVMLAHDPYPEPRAYGRWLEETAGVDAYKLHRQMVADSPDDYGPGVPLEYHHCTWWSSQAVEFVESHQDEPWFLNLNPIDPHPPWFPPAEYLDRYNPDEMPMPVFRESDLKRHEKFAEVDQQWQKPFDVAAFDRSRQQDKRQIPVDERNPWDIPPAEFDPQMVLACYYATIELIDDSLGKVLDALDRTGQISNTIIVFTSDHGDMLGDHGLLYKGCRFFDGLVRVPLVISWPEKWQTGLRSDAIVESIDIAPTLLEAAGIEGPERVQGESLLPILGGRSDPAHHKDHAVSHYNDALPLADATHATMVVGQRYKTVLYHNHPGLGEIYDLREDPGEFVDLWDSDEQLRARLVETHVEAVMRTSDAGIPRTAAY